MVLLDQRFAEALPLIFDFLGVSDPQRPPLRLEPEVRQRQLIGVMRQVIQSVSEEQPTVTLVEDLHWRNVPARSSSNIWLMRGPTAATCCC
jgi:hypothetical protein